MRDACMVAGLDLGCSILGYEVVEQLYVSSTTVVYRAIRNADQQPVIIKYLKSDYPTVHELLQFRNQYAIAKNLDFPGVVKHYSLEPYGNSYVLVMEDGGISLREYSKTQALELGEFLAIALQIVDIINQLHQYRVIHKDIKPDNIVINPQTKEVKLIDFSIASLLPKENQEIQHPYVLQGTLSYISPEQTGRMNRGIDYRSDFYSLGITFFELLTGQLPFQAKDPIELIHCHLAKKPNQAQRTTQFTAREIPQPVSDIIMKLIAKNPEDRYQSALGLKYDLEICLAQWQHIGKIETFEIGQRDMCDRLLISAQITGEPAVVQQIVNDTDADSSDSATFQQAVFNLIGDSIQAWQFVSDAFQQEQMLSSFQEAGDEKALCYFHCHRLFFCYLFGDLESAIFEAIATEKYLNDITELLLVSQYYTYDSLTHLAIYRQAYPAEQQQIEQRVTNNQEKMKIWADSAPANHLHRFYLVEAERYRIFNNKAAAIEFYDLAITTAKANNYPQEEALANELAAKFYLEWGKHCIVQEYLVHAYYCYAHWGATAKIQELEQRYPQFLRSILEPGNIILSSEITIPGDNISTYDDSVSEPAKYSSHGICAALDLAAVLKSFQMLSSEIHLEKLLSTLLQVVLENAGADKCALLLHTEGKLVVEATLAIGQEPIVLQSLALEKSQELPILLINSVKTSLEASVLIDATTDAFLMADPYILHQQPKSVLCTPIMYQGKLLGILYLENNLTKGAFTSDRVEILNLLCTQAAISLENAHLYQRSQIYSRQLELSLEELRASDTRFQNFADNIPGMIYQFRLATDGSMSTPYASSGCYELYEVKPEVVIGGMCDLYSMNHPDDLEKIQQLITHSAQTLTPFKHQWRMITPSGTLKWVQSAAQPQQQKDGSIVWDGIVLDISDRKLAEAEAQQKTQELEQALQDLQQTQLQMVQNEKMSALGNLVAGVAHEINNPLGFLAGNLQPAKDYIQDLLQLLHLYQQQFPDPGQIIADQAEAIDLEYLCEDLPKLIDSMKIGIDRIRSISNSLRTFSRADKDHKIPFNIHEGLNSTILILKHRLKANEQRPAIEVITNYGNLPAVECFPGQLNQVFMNILANAIDSLEEFNQQRRQGKFRPHSHQITIQTELVQDRKIFSTPHVVIRIKDNGIGMSEEVKKRIFEHLFTTKAVGKGTGLGLAIARQIVVERHEGAIYVDSVLGAGSEFTIALPVKTNARQ
jgi:PAS domain S-box-containing protein